MACRYKKFQKIKYGISAKMKRGKAADFVTS